MTRDASGVREIVKKESLFIRIIKGMIIVFLAVLMLIALGPVVRLIMAATAENDHKTCMSVDGKWHQDSNSYGCEWPQGK